MKQPAIVWWSGWFALTVAAITWLGLGAVPLVVLGVWFLRRWALLIPTGAALALVQITPLPAPPEQEVGHRRVVTGEVLELRYHQADRQQYVLQTPAARYLVTGDPYPDVRVGDLVRLQGTPRQPPVFEGFDYRAWLATQGIQAIVIRPQLTITGHRPGWRSHLAVARESLVTRLERLFSPVPAALLSGILIGQRDGLPEPTLEDFRRTGTIHVLALSGYNVSVLVGVLVRALGRRPSVLILSLAPIAGFVLLVGAGASVVRAALMGGLLLLAQALGRPQEAFYAMAISAAVMLAENPWLARHDLGFVLSFAATAGILAWEPAIRHRLGWLPRLLRSPVAVTIAASLPTAPIIAASFGTVSLVSPLANLAVVPLVPWLMLGGLLAYLASLVAWPLAAPVAGVTEAVAGGVLAAVHWFAGWPWASRSVPTGGATLVFGCLAVALLIRRCHAPVR